MSPIKDKFIAKYMRRALFIAQDGVPCLSRGVAAIIVDVELNCEISTGYNGPPKGLPHCNTPEYVENYLIPMMNGEDKKIAKRKLADAGYNSYQSEFDENFCELVCKSGICPRKLLDHKSGERLELCPCAHAETNAIDFSTRSLYGTAIFVSAGFPCFQCCRDIINSGIKHVYCLGDNYPKSNVSIWMLKSAGVHIYNVNEGWINNPESDTLLRYQVIN